MASRLLHRRPDVALAGGCLPSRYALGPVSDGPHDAAPGADVRGAAADPPGRSNRAPAAWIAAPARSRRPRPVPRLACAATLRAPPDAPRRRSFGHGRRDVGLAPAGPVPARAAGAVLARRGTRDVLRGRRCSSGGRSSGRGRSPRTGPRGPSRQRCSSPTFRTRSSPPPSRSRDGSSIPSTTRSLASGVSRRSTTRSWPAS